VRQQSGCTALTTAAPAPDLSAIHVTAENTLFLFMSDDFSGR